MDRVVLREKTVQDKDFFERTKIGVIPVCRGAGATLIATSLAKILSENPELKISYVEIAREKELGNRLSFDALGMDSRFAGRNYTDLFHLTIQGESTRGITNIDEGINWILHAPKTKGSGAWQEDERCMPDASVNRRVLNNAPGDIIICDFEIHREYMELLSDMDVLIVVIDPIPSSLIAGYEVLAACKALEEKGRKICWVINKDNGGVNRRELLKFIRLRELTYIPLIKSEELYSAEYNCLLPIANREVRTSLLTGVNKIIKSIFG